jgi:spore germination protein KB
MLVLIPNINQPAEIKKNSIYIIIIITIIFVSDIVTTIGVLGANLTSHLVFPFLTLARYSRITITLERIETLIMLLWIAPVMVKVTVIHYCTSISCAQIFNLEDYKSLVLPLGILTIVWSIILADNSREFVFIVSKIYPYFAIFLALPLPALLLIIYKIKQKRGIKT